MTLKIIKKNINNIELPRICFWFLLVILITNVFGYIYFVRGTVVDIVQRQNLEKSISNLDSKMISLESEYLKTKNNITSELAVNLGFKLINSRKFVTRDQTSINLSLISADF